MTEISVKIADENPIEKGKEEEGSGYNLNAEQLSSAVKDAQFGYLSHFGGSHGLARALLCDPEAGLIITGENSNRSSVRVLGSSFLTKRKQEFGSNEVEIPKVPPYYTLIWAGLHDVTIIMLILAAVVSLILGVGIEKNPEAWLEGGSILVTVALVLNVQAFTDWNKARQFRKQQLELENSKSVTVIRDGQLKSIHPSQVVVGDIIHISVGMVLPCDGVIIDSTAIKMDESALTGESKLVEKGPSNDPNGKSSPFMLSGTNVMSGEGKMLVLAVGINSLQGRILAAVSKSEDSTSAMAKNPNHEEEEEEIRVQIEDGSEDTEVAAKEKKKSGCLSFSLKGGNLMEKLDSLAILIGKAGTVVALIAFVVMVSFWASDEFGGDDGREFENSKDLAIILEFFITAVTILVVAVPEGLPLAVTLALAVSMRRMTKDNNQVKYMESCETMGSATTICSDKTGTLTQNRMTVVRACIGNTKVEQNDKGELGSVILAEAGQEYCTTLSQALALNTAVTSKVSINSGGIWIYEGNATECALLKLVHQMDISKIDDLRKDPKYRVEGSGLDWGAKSYPFSSERKMMSWVVPHPTKPGAYRLFSKGAPNQIFANSEFVVQPDHSGLQTVPFNGAIKHHFDLQVESFQNSANRTLAIAYRDLDGPPAGGWDAIVPESKGNSIERYVAETKFTLLGVFGIEDPLRPEVIQAIKNCNKAGVDVRMCTGDALATAVAIASQCGILHDRHLEKGENGKIVPQQNFAMTGAEFDERVHRVDTTKPKIRRRAFDIETETEGEMLAYQFLKDDNGNKVLNQQEFDRIWPKLRVLARCQPEDKLTLVRGMRKSEVFRNEKQCAHLKKTYGIEIFPDYQVVAVTGDGTNDAPALKNADVGFAMGIVGTDIAKQACDIMLLDDNFASIVKAVMWGRNVYDSISKFIQFQLTVNIAAITIAVTGAFAFSASPLSAIQMLWINVIMDSLASLALATEPPTQALLERQPYGKRRPIVSRVMYFNMFGQALYQIIVVMTILFAPQLLPGNVEKYPPANHGDSHSKTEASVHWTIIFNTFVMMQLFNEFNSRHLQTTARLRSNIAEWNVFSGVTKNPVFLVVVISTLILQFIIVLYGGSPFSIHPDGLDMEQWLFCIIVGMFSLVWQFVVNGALLAYSAIVGDEKEVKIGDEGVIAQMNNGDEPAGSLRSTNRSVFGRMDSVLDNALNLSQRASSNRSAKVTERAKQLLNNRHHKK